VSPGVSCHGNFDGRIAYVLDHKPQVGGLVRQVLAANGFSSQPFSNLGSFFAEVEANDPELIIVDLAPFSADATDVICELDHIKYQGKILLIGGRDGISLADIGHMGRRHGLAMLPPLRKPFRAADLKRRLIDVAASGRAQTVSDECKAESEKSVRLQFDLERALREDWLELWYQPRVSLRSLSICGAEALLRVRHPRYGMIPPSDLLTSTSEPRSESLFRFVVERALADWTVFAGFSTTLKMSTTLPLPVVASAGFSRFVGRALPRDPQFPGLLIEINEHEINQDCDRIRAAADQLRLYKVWLAIGDFGSIRSSLWRPHDWSFAELKLDRRFVSGCSVRPLKHNLCQTVIDLAHHLGMSVCAEGVESPKDLQSLIVMGCDMAQGTLFARPMPAAQFAKMLQRGEQIFPLQWLGKCKSAASEPILAQQARAG